MSTNCDAILDRKIDYLVSTVENVAAHILKIPGDKVISIATVHEQGVFTFTDGLVAAEQENQLTALLELILDGIIADGMIVIRQFTGETGITRVRGISTIVPTVNTYAIRLSKGKWRGLPAEHVEMICSLNLSTGDVISEPLGVKYLDFVS